MDFLNILVDFAIGLISKKPKEEIQVSIPLESFPEEPKKPETAPDLSYLPTTAIDWTNGSMQITDHFTVADAITLHSWNRLANESDGLTDDGKQKLVTLCNKMEEVRKILNCSINVHCMFRSSKYNAEVVKAIPNDVHQQCLAVDFDTNGHHTIDESHAILEPLLERLGMRMERNTPTWVHLDLHPVGNARYFNA